MSERHFYNPGKKLWPVLWPETNLEMPKSIDDIPYRPAHLHKHKNMGKIRYFIEYFAWNPAEKKLKRIRKSFDLNQKMTDARRAKRAEYLIQVINRQLERGMQYRPKSKKKSEKPQKLLTIKEVIEIGHGIKQKRGLSASTNQHYGQYKDYFVKWLKKHEYDNIKAYKFTSHYFEEFLDSLKTEKKYSNKTYNLWLGGIRTFINEAIAKYPDIWKTHPMERFKQLLVKSSKHAAFNNKQMEKIVSWCKRKSPELLDYITMAYYTLARPVEVRNIKAGHIDLEFNRILIKKDHAKKDERYCEINSTLKRHIIEKGYHKLPGHYYIFGRAGLPGTEHIGKDFFNRRNKKMLDDLGFRDRDYTIYGYKHSGAISLWDETKDLLLIQRQMGHKNINQTVEYMRDLGRVVDLKGQLKDWGGAV